MMRDGRTGLIFQSLIMMGYRLINILNTIDLIHLIIINLIKNYLCKSKVFLIRMQGFFCWTLMDTLQFYISLIIRALVLLQGLEGLTFLPTCSNINDLRKDAMRTLL